MVRSAALSGLFCLLTSVAQASECRLALLLAMDVSSSVDAAEDALQRGGLAAALTAADVQTAFLAGDQHVALAVFEWSGRYNQQVLLGWTVIDSRAALLFAAEKIASSTRSHDDFPTAMGHALGYGAGMLKRSPDCLYKTMDVAGDGQNNDGFGPEQAYNAFPFDGIVVNGLIVNGADFEAETGLIAYYKGHIIRGPGSFVEIAQGFEDYERAMRRKLERELSLPVVGSAQRPPIPKS